MRIALSMQSGMITKMDIDNIMERQYDWVDRMGWHNKTVLEALALVASEVGEAVDECRGETPTHELGTELADIILRVADLAKWQKVALATFVAEDRQTIGCHNKTVLEVLALIVSEIGAAVNECRGVEPTAKFGIKLANIIAIVTELADALGIDLATAIEAKMEVNERRGTRGRRI